MRRSDFVIDGNKRCSKCRAWKPIAEFNTDKKRVSGFCPQCKACHAETRSDKRSPEYFKAWRAEKVKEPGFREVERERSKYHSQTVIGREKRRKREKRRLATDPKFRDKRNSRHAAWYAAHAGDADFKRKKKEASDRWRAANRDTFNLKSHRRRARVKGAEGDGITVEQWHAIVAVFDGKCAYCHRGVKLTIDHFVPLATGGNHGLSNIVPACESCNKSKGGKDPFEWMDSKKFDGDYVIAGICETRHIA